MKNEFVCPTLQEPMLSAQTTLQGLTAASTA